ncbi:MAG: S8 family serine peptidase [bacterium]|nr:S8 family serine peptidase [bacterium]
MRQILFLSFLFFGLNLYGQQKFYFVEFKDKPQAQKILYNPSSYISIRAIERRTRNRVPLNVNDIPPDSAYLAQLAQLPLLLYGSSRWLNGAIILSGTKDIEAEIKTLPFVTNTTYVGPAYFYDEQDQATENSLENQLQILAQTFENKKERNDSQLLGKSFAQLEQINAANLIKSGMQGKNVLIAVIDAGFRNLDQLKAFNHLFTEKRIIATRDFVELEEEVFDDDEHGLSVMSCLAAYQPGLICGAAPASQYLLLRSENAASEYLVEEYFWTLAAEFADSAGADIINSSLGYTKHDEKVMGHKYSELDGKTTIVSKAAQIAASKGILVAVSAGNEGNDPWRQLSAPADVAEVLTIGAIDKHGSYASFSSVGPTADKRMKPDLAALGKNAVLISQDGKVFEGNGTSYACPIIAGTAAILLQADPNASAQKIKEVLMLTANQFYKPDKYVGSGIPDIELAAKCIRVKTDSILDFRELPDRYMYVIINARTNQKVNLLITEPINKEIEKQYISLKKGLNRIQLKGYKKRPSGIYHLSVEFGQKKGEADFSKP